MPELPEVETYVRELERPIRDKQVVGTTVRWARTIATPAVNDFLQAMAGQRFTAFDRRGKYMLLGLTQEKEDSSTQTLIVHLRMTGQFVVYNQPQAPARHTHVIFDLDDGSQLHFQDARKFGRIWLVADPQEVLAKLGPEPFGDAFALDRFAEELAGRTAPIKSLLLDQSIVAGVGNIYADESLHLAGIHPTRHGGSLSHAEIVKLREAIQRILQQAIDGHGSSLGKSGIQNYQRPSGEPGSFQKQHRVFQRTGDPCFTCGTTIERIVLAQRGTHFCPQCQSLAS